MGGGNPPFGMDFAAAVLHAVADLLLVHIQPELIHGSHEEPPWCLRISGVAESAFLHQALLP